MKKPLDYENERPEEESLIQSVCGRVYENILVGISKWGFLFLLKVRFCPLTMACPPSADKSFQWH